MFFIIHVIYLIAVSNDQFFNKWVDGSFTFFVSLVMCNIIRARVVAKAGRSDTPDDAGRGQDGPA
jgi:hypothetical protein